MRKRLADARGASRSARRGGVMVVPAILPVDVWEAQALASQEKLVADARDSIAVGARQRWRT